jgi:hypothetical protein
MEGLAEEYIEAYLSHKKFRYVKQEIPIVSSSFIGNTNEYGIGAIFIKSVPMLSGWYHSDRRLLSFSEAVPHSDKLLSAD